MSSFYFCFFILRPILPAGSSCEIALLSASCECGLRLHLLIALNFESGAFGWFRAVARGRQYWQSYQPPLFVRAQGCDSLSEWSLCRLPLWTQPWEQRSSPDNSWALSCHVWSPWPVKLGLPHRLVGGRQPSLRGPGKRSCGLTEQCFLAPS